MKTLTFFNQTISRLLVAVLPLLAPCVATAAHVPGFGHSDNFEIGKRKGSNV